MIDSQRLHTLFSKVQQARQKPTHKLVAWKKTSFIQLSCSDGKTDHDKAMNL